MYKAICRALQKGIDGSQEVYALIKANLAYAVTGSSSTFDVFSIERSISQKKSEVSDMVKLIMKSGGNVEITALRQQLSQAQRTMQDSIWANEKIIRTAKWLEKNEIVFDEYDDVVVRRLVDTVRVNNDDTITVILKGGIEITEPLDGEKL